MLVEDVRAKFPIKNIPNVIVEPTYKAINELREALCENTAAIPTTLGGGVAMAALVYLWMHNSMLMC